MNEIQQLNQQIAFIANVAREYANATPEQRSKIDPQIVQATIQQYNDLKARRDALYIEQEARVQNELNQRRAEAEAAQIASQWRGRVIPKKEVVVRETPTTQWTWTQFNENSSYKALPATRKYMVDSLLSQWKYIWNDWLFHNADWSLYTARNWQMYVTWDWVLAWKGAINWDSMIDKEFTITPVHEWDSGLFPELGDEWNPSMTWGVVGINPTNEQFRISQVINWHTYEYWDNGSVKIDWVLQRAGNWTDYIIRETPVNNTWFNNTRFNNTGVNNYTWYVYPYYYGTWYNTWFNNSWYNYTWYNGTGNWFNIR